MSDNCKPPYTRPETNRHSTTLEVQAQLIDILNQTLATTVDLKTQVKQACWNVKSINIHPLQELFHEIAMELEMYIDLLAQRVTTLGGLARGTARAAVKNSVLPEYPFHITERQEHLASLAERLSIYGSLLWENIDRTAILGDAETAYLYAEISRVIDKRLWFLDEQLMTSRFDENHPTACHM
ncbi:DNA starvation/stationary phase protection protein Dps [Brasilonema sp. UFV-L1]|uniref:DNA starvation/stationary phase protection protein Dps n=1 Tax=Brasilonema sp. UFV-L1 TaxID=2234130 RepID=UPI00145CFB60|nr:DNA starvation/stationary phase protection protein Dps [Brasilonema sp. UFV-L1]NMG09259.1 DNA starvation/stationary phase protection protein Dps [Brasilonema sp. UFV-L1]